MEKILILGSFPAPYRVEVFKGLAQQYKADVFFFTDKDQNRNKDYFVKKESFRYYVLNNNGDKDYFQECIRKLDSYDMVIAYDWYLPFAIKIELKCIMKKIPYVINCDGAFLNANNIKDKIKGIIKRYCIKNATKCFASGEYAKKYFEYYGARESNICIHNFTSLSEDDILNKPVDKEEKVQLRNKLGLKNKKTVLSIGQFIPRKGFDILLRTWKEFDDEYQLVIIGGGDEKDYYIEIVDEENLGNVNIIEFMPKDKIMDYYKASDIFILLTHEDIWGLVINEAMACGLPVITTNKCIAGLELIKDDVNGYIVDINDNEKIKNKMRILLENDDIYNIISKNNINSIQSNTINNIVKSHIDSINSIYDNL